MTAVQREGENWDRIRSWRQSDKICRIDPYESPADALEKSGVHVQRQSSTPIKVRGREESGVYSEVSDSIRIPHDEGEELGGGASEDRPYETVEYDKVSPNIRQNVI